MTLNYNTNGAISPNFPSSSSNSSGSDTPSNASPVMIIESPKPILAPQPKKTTGTTAKPTNKRSKNGCLSCKRLKIKCNEDKPSCEYCVQTRKQCIYPKKVPMKVIRKRNTKQLLKKQEEEELAKQALGDKSSDEDIIEINAINNRPLRKLNSMSFQLDVTKFELQLLKFYLDFGAEFFTFNLNDKALSFWGDEVPQLWCGSDLIKSSLYAVSSARLLANYEYDSIKNVYIENEEEQALVKKINLFEQVEKYINRTLELIQLYGLTLEGTPTDEIVDIVGQLIIAKKSVTGAKAIIPRKLEIDRNTGLPRLRDLQLYQILKESSFFFNRVFKFVPLLANTKYSYVFDPDIEVPNIDEAIDNQTKNQELIFITHLRNYFNEKTDPLDPSRITYLHALTKFEQGCYKTLFHKFPIALFKIFIEISGDVDFLVKMEEMDHPSLKLIFYTSCLNFIFHYKLYQKNGMHDEYINFYRNYSMRKFNGNFEDEMDKNFYDVVIARTKTQLPYDFNIMKHLGQPVELFLNGSLTLTQAEFPSVFF